MTNQKTLSERTRIVVIDDDAGIRDSLTDLLALEDWSCVTAENGQKGLALVESEKPHLVVTDIRGLTPQAA